MADKYTGLPGIDIESADIFETSDVDSEVEVDVQPTLEGSKNNSDIEEQELDLTQARNRFSNDVLVDDINVIDFLGSIANRSLTKTGYQVNKVDETVEQRLSRISRELEEIKILQLKDTSETQTKACDTLLNTLESLVKDPGSSEATNLNQYHHRITQVFDDASARLESPDSDPTKLQKPPLVETSQVLSLESRLHAIERALGPEILINTQSPGETKPTIRNCVNELARKINVVHNPEYQLDTIRQEVALMNREVETLAANKKFLDLSPVVGIPPQRADPNPSHRHSKIEDLHAKLPHFNQFNDTAPSIIARLKTLHAVHADVANTVQTVHNLDQILDDIKSDMKKWNHSINTLNTNIDEHEAQVVSNRDYVNLVIKELTEKVSSLSQ